MNDNPLESFSLEPAPNDRKLVMLVYILQGLGLVTGGLTWVVGAMVNYLKLDSVRGTWLESHFRWQITSFWYALLWWVVGLVLWLLMLGGVAWMILTIWVIYRIVKGALRLSDNLPIKIN